MRRPYLRSVPATALLVSAVACGGLDSADPDWREIGASPDSVLWGEWENPATGHVVRFGSEGRSVFHVLDDFCIRDTGVVPPHALYRLSDRDDRLELHHYDYRSRPALLQAPQVYRRTLRAIDGCYTATDSVPLPELTVQIADASQ